MHPKKILTVKVLFALAAVSSVATATTISVPALDTDRVVSDQNLTNAVTTDSSIIGNVNAGRNDRTGLQFDLSAIPDGSPILSASLTFNITGYDTSGNAVNTDDGTGNLELFEYSTDPDRAQGYNYRYQSFGPNATGGGDADDVPWTNLGGDFTAAGALSTIQDTSFDPTDSAIVGTTFTFADTASLRSAVSANLGDDNLELQIAMPALAGTGTRSFVRAGSTTNGSGTPDFTLTVTVPEPTGVALAFFGFLAIVARVKRS